jgi:hypothetical protein
MNIYTSNFDINTKTYTPPTNSLLDNKTGLRYNNGKLRYDLFEPHAMNQLAKVFTAGALKYAERNWEKGMKWSSVIASLKRHVAKFENGEDFDEESELNHMAHVAWNALALVSYSKYHPNYDDRPHTYLNSKRIGLDIDECIANFTGAYGAKTGADISPSHWSYCYDVVKNFEKWGKEGTLDSFYLDGVASLLNGNDLPFEPICYITNRPVDSNLTKRWLKRHNFPLKEVYTTKNRAEKVTVALEQKLDYFIDDNFETFVEMQNSGICAFLMDAPHNKKYNVGYKRIMNFNDFKQRFL